MSTRRKVLLGGAGLVALGAGGLAGRRWRLDREPDLPAPLDAQGRALWSNWAGNAHAYPVKRAAPASEAELVALLPDATTPIRPVGSGHSFTALVPTEGTLLSLDRLSGLVRHDATSATVRAGTKLSALGPLLAGIGQEMPNLPDINKQTLAGGLATGTHGTGKHFKALHGEVTALRLVLPSGEVAECGRDQRPELFHAARVGLGAFGVLSEVTLQNQPLSRVRKVVTLVDTEQVLRDWPALAKRHRNAEFLVLPFTGKSALITHDVTTEPVRPRGPDQDASTLMDLKRLRDLFEFTPALRRRAAQAAMADIPPEVAIDEGWKLLSNERPVRFKEMEYHLPIAEQVGALREVIARIERDVPGVFFPIEARIIAPDDAWLSPFYQRESGSIAVHAWYKEDHDWMFRLIEPVLREAGGRPHWGKLHSLGAAEMRTLYPMFTEADAVRRAVDPMGRMVNPFLQKLFG
ncbi:MULTISPECIES: D-arabinono-1,4-lactone oxidase [unclassified Novosphingobium]|uniref:D-arabinono-1,4-lactone oxidase n=1 Tax=unclassified Novosphingobium TaxID=2644732 RepID=UPI000EC64579|nr:MULTISPECIES: D-arabinono-1,4-lactone oxidase [unclassified Novosphingobium]HCF24952.1 oxidoreductase [Novosphingobium sp.]HQV03140.1 D-arabinono-1,4-lactone oxidase [Novosphingobium sp.]